MNNLLISSNLQVPESLNLQLLAGRAAVNVLNVVGSCLEVAGGVVALGNKNTAAGAVLDRGVQRNRGSLIRCQIPYRVKCKSLRRNETNPICWFIRL